MNLSEHLFLFDIDGTIIDTAGDGKKSIVRALEDSLDIKIEPTFNFLGGIDLIFFRESYNKYLFPEEKFNYYWNISEKKYIDNMRECLKNDWKIFPNSFEVIKYLYEFSNISLATGNMKKGAEIKLEKFGLNKYFNCGGYGDSVFERSQIVVDAINDSEKFYKKKFSKDKIFLFGDTQKDVQSALDNNIIPVLIDYRNLNYENAEKWKTKYYGNFNGFENFIDKINYTNYKEVIYF